MCDGIRTGPQSSGEAGLEGWAEHLCHPKAAGPCFEVTWNCFLEALSRLVTLLGCFYVGPLPECARGGRVKSPDG